MMWRGRSERRASLPSLSVSQSCPPSWPTTSTRSAVRLPSWNPERFFQSSASTEMLANPLRHRLADALDGLQIGDAGARHRAGGAEMQQQGALAAGADAGNLVERRLRDLL